MQRNVSLDYYRALAILLVFLGHCVLSFGAPLMLAPLQLGGTGVDLFFVLSGWLIGNQLLVEKSKFGNIQITRFWIRRWMRTVPAYYAVLFLTITQLYLTKMDFAFPWPHVFFLQNYIGDLSVFFVSWSLSVEEQFYLFIAPLFVITLRFSKKLQVLVLLILLLSPSVFRYLELYSTLNETHVRLDCCAMGVLLAYCKHYHLGSWSRFQRKIVPIFAFSIVCYLFFYIARYNPSWNIPEPSKLLLAIIFGTWIVWGDKTKFNGEGLLTKIIMHISTRSYSMYLLHVDVLALMKKLPIDMPFLLFVSVSLLFTLIASECLYRSIELPFMKARSMFTFSSSRKHKLADNRGLERI